MRVLENEGQKHSGHEPRGKKACVSCKMRK